MDGSRFDAWTRRRFGAAAGGLAGSLLGLAAFTGTAAKKRCRKLGEPCKQDGSRKKKCCKGKGLQCREDPPLEFRCCRKGGEPCTDSGEASQCCSLDCREGTCFCKALGQSCGTDRHCCSFNCDTSVGGSFQCEPAQASR
jgi:hypothetical protein